MIEGIKRNATTYVVDSIVRKTDSRLNKGEDVVVCLPGARIEHMTERVDKIMGRGKGGTIMVHVGTNNADKEGTTVIVDKYRNLLNKTKEARVGQIIMSGLLPVFGNRIDGYRNSKRMAINGTMKRLCKEEDVGYVDLWDSFVGKKLMYARDGLHLSGKAVQPLLRDCQGITESWAHNDITYAELGLEGYVMFRKDRIGKKGGGVLLYTNDTIPAYEVQLKDEADCNEAIWCILVTGHTTVTIGVVYRCPKITIQDNNKIHNAISEVSKGDCIIMGDFNHGHI